MKVLLETYNNDYYSPCGTSFKRFVWYFINATLFISPCFPINWLKIQLLRLFGAVVGKGVTIKPAVNIKYPWLLEIGDFCWIGESVWIDNLVKVKMGSNCCLSQGAMLLTGNHNYEKSTFDLIVKEIVLEDGVWIGAKSIVAPGVTCRSHSVLSVSSVASSDLEPYKIYRGNPAVPIKERIIV
jgi:putative colanic acid biosynthesis acetyltransferase WcaF